MTFLLLLFDVRTKKVDWPTVRMKGLEVRVQDRSVSVTEPLAQAVDKGYFIRIEACEGRDTQSENMVTPGTWQSLEKIRPVRDLMPGAEPEGLDATAGQRAPAG